MPNKIKEILQEMNMTQMELADIVGINKSHLSKIVNGTGNYPSVKLAVKIAEALNKNVKDVFYETTS